jgi:5-methyltetrahydropteroyltriglutamate--homocysteine methyltransferase
VPPSTSRILTTHVGSLPRPDELAADLIALDEARPDAPVPANLARRVRAAVADAVRRQVEVGIDVVSDGEMSKSGYAMYVKERLAGFGGEGEPLSFSELADVPGFAPPAAPDARAPACVGPVAYVGDAVLATDLDNLALGLEATWAKEAFMNAASPGVIRDYLVDRYYGSEEDYLAALAEAMKREYDAIVSAGFVLQLDCPDLAMGRHLGSTPIPVHEFRRHVMLRVRTINHALRDIPRDRVRIHICWGNYESPHHHDVPLADIVDLVLQIDAGTFLFEAANPRHEHEWQVFRDISLPDDTTIVPGVIDSLTNYVEHPELVAQRLLRYTRVVGAERVIAGTDCGFASSASHVNVHPQVTWLKLAALVEGAALATERLRAAAAATAAVRTG